MNHTTSHRAVPGARPTAAFTDYIAEELRRYDEHLLDIRGLAVGTRSQRARIVGRLLNQKFAGRPVDITKLRPDDVRRFLAGQLDAHRTPSNASQLVLAG